MSRIGKIACLPRSVRETLNCRLHEGEPGSQLIAWLNAEPAVQAVLAEHFEGRPINAQNLSDWRRGGYADWCRQEQILELAVRLQEEGEEMDEVAAPHLTHWLAQASALAVLGQLRATGAMEEGPPKLRAVLATVRAVDRLRRTELEEGRAKREADWDERKVRAAEIEAAREQAEEERRSRARKTATDDSPRPAPIATAVCFASPRRAASEPPLSNAQAETALISADGKERRVEETPVRRAA